MAQADIKGSGQKLYLHTNLHIIFGITLMAVLGVSSITPAFPRIIEKLNISTQAIGMLITVFTLPGVVLTPVMGVLADQYGRKRILVPSLMVFGIAGGACAFARDFNLLLIFRFLQGIGAASLGSLNVTIIGDLYSGQERTTAMGYNASVLSIGTASYPALGGGLAMFGWFYPFLLPLLAVPLGFIVLFSLKNPRKRSRQHIKEQFLFALREMKNRQVIGLFISSVITFIILYGPYLTYFPILMGGAYNASSLEIGMIFTSMSAVTAVTSSQIGKITKKFPEQTLIKFSFLIYGAAIFVIPFIPCLWLLLIPAMVFGVAHGSNMPCIMSLLSGLAPREYRATFMSINGMVLRLGQTLGPLVMGVIVGIWGIESTFYAGAGLGLFMFLSGFFFLKPPH